MLKEFIKDTAFAARVSFTKHTDSADVLDLIAKLRPQECGKNLIRIGGAGDGGYLLPNDLEEIQYCFLPRVGGVEDFESYLTTLNIRSFLAEYSVASPPNQRPEFTFDRKFLSVNDTEISFTLKSLKEIST